MIRFSAFFLICVFVSGCLGSKEVLTPQQTLQYHADQPIPESERIVEDAIGQGASVKVAVGTGLVPWLAASKGFDDNRVYEGKAKTPDQLNLAEGSNNPAASGDDIHQAAAIKVLGVLLRNGADKDVIDSLGENALHKAVLSGRARVAEFLLATGVGVDVQDRAGYTPLMRAVGMGHLGLTKLLLSHGASTAPQNKYGQNVMHLAEESGRRELIEVFTAHGGLRSATEQMK